MGQQRLGGGYVIDTCVIINLIILYPREIFAGLMDDIEKSIVDGTIIAPKQVLEHDE